MNTGIFATEIPDGALEANALDLESTFAVPAILEIMVRSTHDLEFMWWKSENRAARCFTMAIYLCAADDKIASSPEFDIFIKRFNEQEQQERNEERTFILEYRPALAGIIAEILQKRDLEQYNAYHKDDFEPRAKMGSGKRRLPKWCKEADIENDSEQK